SWKRAKPSKPRWPTNPRAGDAERHGGGPPDQAAQALGLLGHFGFDGFAFFQDAGRAFQRRAAAFRERQAARGAMEQHGLHAGFQARDGLGYGGLRQFSGSRRARERAGLGHLGEQGPGFQVGEFLHALVISKRETM